MASVEDTNTKDEKSTVNPEPMDETVETQADKKQNEENDTGSGTNQDIELCKEGKSPNSLKEEKSENHDEGKSPEKSENLKDEKSPESLKEEKSENHKTPDTLKEEKSDNLKNEKSPESLKEEKSENHKTPDTLKEEMSDNLKNEKSPDSLKEEKSENQKEEKSSGSKKKEKSSDSSKEENSQDTGKTKKKDPHKESELDKYWQPVKENPGDFTGWTYLLQYVEQEKLSAAEIENQDDIDTAKEAYDAFLAKYPYCYGYWKKHADMQKRHTDLAGAIQVFERGVKAIPLSSELWLHYINFYAKEFLLEEEIRKLYERALTAAGTDFRSDKLWDSYISWEKERDKKKMTAVYDRLLKIPTQLYSHHYDNFKKHVLSYHPKEILSLDEFIKLRTEVVKENQDSGALGAADDAAPPGDEEPPGVESQDGKGDAEEANQVRSKVLKLREATHKRTEEEVSRRWAYEEGIKRPYFHVKPLERIQLKNWKDYLDFEIQSGTHERVVVLFERCMIAAALYEDFWLKYAKYLEEHITKTVAESDDTQEKKKEMEEQGFEAVRSVYRRACNIHLPKKPYIHMAWAAFEERQGKHGEAWKILTNLEEQVPGMVMVAMRRISLERRIGDKEKTEMLFQEYIDKATDSDVQAFYVIKFARYLYKVLGDEMKAKKIITDALEKDPKNEKLYVQLLDIEYQKHPVDVESTLQIFAQAVSSEHLSMITKIKMSQRRLEFLEDFGSSILQLKECYDEHQKMLKDMQSEKKRKQPDSPTEDVSLVEKKMKTNGAATPVAPPPIPPAPTPAPVTHDQQAMDYSSYWAHYQNTAGGGYGYQNPGWGGYGQYYNS